MLYVFHSLVRTLCTMFVVVSLVFVILRVGPLDPAQYILGDYATAEALRALRDSMGLNRPIYTQYLSFLMDLFHGELGQSFLNQEPVLKQLIGVLPYTLELVFAGVLMGIMLGLPPGILAALRPNSMYDQGIRLLTLVGISVPIFVTGIFLISLFALKLDLLPATGASITGGIRSHALSLILPAFSCGFMMMASIARLVRASLLEVLSKDYILTARSKGLKERIVVCKHALRNSLLPLVTFLGIYVNILLGSAVLVEVIFTRPGVGRLIVEAIRTNDFPVVQTAIMFYAGAVVLVNLLVDIAYLFLDPRIIYK